MNEIFIAEKDNCVTNNTIKWTLFMIVNLYAFGFYMFMFSGSNEANVQVTIR